MWLPCLKLIWFDKKLFRLTCMSRPTRKSESQREMAETQKPSRYVPFIPRGRFQIRRSGCLDLTSILETTFGARSGQVHQIRGKIWEVLSPQDAKVGKKSQFWGHIRNSEDKIWGICHLYFWRQNLGLQQEFQRQILRPSPSLPLPPPPNMEVPLGRLYSEKIKIGDLLLTAFTW